MINRRSFLQRLIAGAVGTVAAAELDIERLLWVPKPMIAVPAATFTRLDWIAREALRQLEKNLTLASTFNRQYEYPIVGQTLNIRKPGRSGRPGAQTIHGVQLDWELVDSAPFEQVSRDLDIATANLAHRIRRNGDSHFAQLDLPRGVEACRRVDSDSASLRVVKHTMVDEDQPYLRLDVLTGKGAA